MGDNVKEYEEQLAQILKQKYNIMKKAQSDEIRVRRETLEVLIVSFRTNYVQQLITNSSHLKKNFIIKILRLSLI